MKVNISKITSCINKITDITSGEKIIPGVLMEIVDGKQLKVAYHDTHKALVEYVDVTAEEGDVAGPIIVEYAMIKRAIANCQPSGSIKVKEVTFTANEAAKKLTISAEQNFEQLDAEGNVASSRTLATKRMELNYYLPGENNKIGVLTRKNYEEIFEFERVDTYDRKELMDALNRTSVEKGRSIYISKQQNVFVSNQSHVTSVPLSNLLMLSDTELETLKNEVRGSKEYTSEEEYAKDVEKAISDRIGRVHMSIALTQQIARAIIGVFGKTNAEMVYVYTSEDKSCSMFVDSEDEKVGFWFQMAQSSKAHIGALSRYASLKYRTYHTTFLREFLADNIKSALDATKSERTVLKFEPNEEGGSFPKLVIKANSSSSSVSDVYSIGPNDLVDPTNDITTKSFNISLKVFSDMLSQLKTDYVAVDMEVGPDGTTCLRLSEIDTNKMFEAYGAAREKTKVACEQQGIPFVAESKDGQLATPTPVEYKLDMRDASMLVKQYTMLVK